MSLSDLASLGSFAGGIAVIISFVFLGLQLRQANLNQRSLIQQGRSDRTVSALQRLTDERASGIVTRVFKGDRTLNDAELFSFYGIAASIFWSYEDSFLQFQSGSLDAKSWNSDVSTLRGLLTNPAYRAAWRAGREAIVDEYRDFMDAMMLEVKGRTPRNVATAISQLLAEEFEATKAVG